MRLTEARPRPPAPWARRLLGVVVCVGELPTMRGDRGGSWEAEPRQALAWFASVSEAPEGAVCGAPARSHCSQSQELSAWPARAEVGEGPALPRRSPPGPGAGAPSQAGEAWARMACSEEETPRGAAPLKAVARRARVRSGLGSGPGPEPLRSGEGVVPGPCSCVTRAGNAEPRHPGPGPLPGAALRPPHSASFSPCQPCRPHFLLSAGPAGSHVLGKLVCLSGGERLAFS